MEQIRQEANVNNARQLIDVRLFYLVRRVILTVVA